VIYDEPVFRALGDCYVAVEFGDEADIVLSFRVLTLAQLLSAERLAGIVEVQPSPRELAIIFDRTLTTRARVEEATRSLLESTPLADRLLSRVVTLPTWYDDPWSARTAERFGVEHNLQYVADHNGLTREQVVARHAGAVHWNSAVGFTPGCNWYFPMDRSQSLSAPTYRSPRSFTPARAVGLLGRGTSTYPLESPGGIQLIGRIAVEIFDPDGPASAFGPDGVLLRTGDRITHRPIDALEYDEIRAKIAAGRYEYEIEDGELDLAKFVNAMEEATAVTQPPDREGPEGLQPIRDWRVTT
jgi:KipI family sensor histidine kinase inhibitor